MNRRRWLKGLGATAVLGATGVGALTAAVRFRGHPYFTSLDEVRAWLAKADVGRLTSTGTWSVAQILSHGAQSIELSLSGYPELKPAWFRSAVGPAAFHAFDALGGMRHGLDELIPGTRASDLLTDPAAAARRLSEAIVAFDESEDVTPHFAYGELNWQQLDQAHAMHISEHLVEVAGG